MIQSNHSTASLAGIVLCGGESKRMGTDKGLILDHGLPWFKRVGALIMQFNIPVYYSIRSEQLEPYKRYSNIESFIIDDVISEGPLRGVVSAMNATTVESLLVIACDMRDLQASIIAKLLKAYSTETFEFYAFLDKDFYEPFREFIPALDYNDNPVPEVFSNYYRKETPLGFSRLQTTDSLIIISCYNPRLLFIIFGNNLSQLICLNQKN